MMEAMDWMALVVILLTAAIPLAGTAGLAIGRMQAQDEAKERLR